MRKGEGTDIERMGAFPSKSKPLRRKQVIKFYQHKLEFLQTKKKKKKSRYQKSLRIFESFLHHFSSAFHIFEFRIFQLIWTKFATDVLKFHYQQTLHRLIMNEMGNGQKICRCRMGNEILSPEGRQWTGEPVEYLRAKEGPRSLGQQMVLKGRWAWQATLSFGKGQFLPRATSCIQTFP